jgi:GntR family transcriptional regulator
VNRRPAGPPSSSHDGILGAEGELLIDKRSAIPYYHQLKEYIVGQIGSASWVTNSKLPSESQLCGQFGVSRTVVRQALNELQNEGYLLKEKGRGTFVAGPKIIEGLVQNLSGFTEDMSKRGFKVSNTILEQTVLPASDSVAKALQVDTGTAVMKIRRVRNLDREPVAVSTTYIAESLCPGLLQEDLRNTSLYFLLESKYRLKIFEGRRFISVCRAGEELSALLHVSTDSPLMALENVTYLQNGKPLEYFLSYHRGDISKFEITIRRVNLQEPEQDGRGAPLEGEGSVEA